MRALRLSLQELVEPSLERPDQIDLFGSRARGDWDGLSDTDLHVVAANKNIADTWVDQLLDSGLAEDVIGLDREAWAQGSGRPPMQAQERATLLRLRP